MDKTGDQGSANAAAAHDGASATAPSATLGPAAISVELGKLGTSPKGLSADEAKSRLEKYGPNAIQAHEASRWGKLAGYFWGPIPWMIEAAALISFLRRDWPDFAVVGGLLLYNAAVGFWQDNKAANALAALKKGLALKARTLRGNQWLSIDAAELVPGDVVTIAAGEIVPADVLLIAGDYLSVDQAALTGESLPVAKRVGDGAYSGSIAKQGSMTAVVTATGNQTFFGRTAKLVAAAGSKSHSEQAVLQIGDFLILLAGALALVLIGFQVYRDVVVADVWGWVTVGAIAQFVLVLLIASVPVAMPAVMSVTMALGALALSKQKAIVSRLSAIEELAGVDVLCSDKTGTLTMNQLKLDAPIPYGTRQARGRGVRRRPGQPAQQRGRDRRRGVPGARRPEGARHDHPDRVRAVRPRQQEDGGDGDRRPGPHLPLRQGGAAGDRRAVQARSGHPRQV